MGIQHASFALTTALLCGVWSLAWPMNVCGQQSQSEKLDASPVATIVPTAPASADPTQASAENQAMLRQRIDELIERLGDESYQTRRMAELSLMRIGLPAFEQLRQAMNHPNVQIDVAARYLVRSQAVTWWLDTDPLSVRQLLQDYNDQKDTDRETAMQKLASEKSADALMALCRIARYESSEPLSKCAALYLMETFVDRIAPAETATFSAHVREALGDSERPAAAWVEVLVDSLRTGDLNVDRWRSVSTGEYMLLQKNPRETNRTLVTRLHRVIAAYLIKQSERQLALDIVRPCLDLVENRSVQVRNAAIWAIDAGLPELAENLAERHGELFKSDPHLGFLLAESFSAIGDEARAQASAEAASSSIARPIMEQSAFNVTQAEIEAAQRESLAQLLQQRGLFDWAAIEYSKGLKLDLQPRIEMRLRVRLAMLKSDSEAYGEAAAILEDFLTEIQANPIEIDRLTKSVTFDGENDLAFLKGSFNHYAGLAAIQNRQLDIARSHLVEALKHSPENPDILIALKDAVEPGANDHFYQQSMLEHITAFHAEIASTEQELLSADRLARPNLEYNLATQCNQLAWLLSKTSQRPQEALQLSLRSLELVPNYAIYQDTLARCYFSAGEVDKAIATQELAIKSEPHQPTMLRQLEEFKAAKQRK